MDDDMVPSQLWSASSQFKEWDQLWGGKYESALTAGTHIRLPSFLKWSNLFQVKLCEHKWHVIFKTYQSHLNGTELS